MLIIAIGSFKSLEEMIKQFKRVHIEKKAKSEDIETLGWSDTLQFPVMAGVTLCGLYFAMQYFGNDVVNHLLVGYIALGGTIGVKSMLQSFTGAMFDAYDKDLLLDVAIKYIDLELQVTLLDIFCCIISFIQMGLYVYFKNWIYNNILALVFCIHALHSMFIGNFKNGFTLLILLFFYDIFFVFGTDVMLTVAKGINAPIKLMFPKDYSGEKPQFSILGLGDIVIPGIFVSLCLRFDFIKSLNQKYVGAQLKKMEKGEDADVMKYLYKQAVECPKSYFIATNVGYLIAIICTIIVMLVFDHGQPALLYLVPGCLLAVLGTAAFQGELSLMWDFDEEEFTTPSEEEQERLRKEQELKEKGEKAK